MTDLIQRLEKTMGGFAELDNAIYERFEMLLIDQRWPVPSYTTSIDAALALAERVLSGAYSLTMNIDPSGNGAEIVWWPRGLSSSETEVRGNGVNITLPLAICIAVLKASEAQSNEQ